MPAYAPSAVFEGRRAAALTRVYLVLVGNEYQISTNGPADASLALNAAGEQIVSVASTAKLAQTATGHLVAYGG